MVAATAAWCASLHLLLVLSTVGGWWRFGAGLLVAVVALVALLFFLGDLDVVEVRL